MPDSKRDTNGKQDAFSESKAAFSSPREAELALKPNQTTRQVKVGKVTLGGGAPCVVQSMLNLPLEDVEGNLAQIERLAEAGCELIRIAIPHKRDLNYFEEICQKSVLPVIADIHFSAEIAIEAAKRGAAKLRINPGNIGGLEACVPVLEAARNAGIPIRIGVNAGSLDEDLAARNDLTLPEKLAESARGYVEFCESQGFYDLVVSAKAHDVPTTVEAYRLLSKTLPTIPLHIGVTEAGTLFQGLIKSASGLGILLEQGIGDTLRISLTDDPVEEVRACWMLLSALGLRRRDPELVSCPTCGRCQVDLISIAKEVEDRLKEIHRPLQVAVMGCVVNGPGEAADADIGVACGKGSGVIFTRGKTLRKVEEAAIVDVLMEEIGRL
ncbi:MAG: flavodoxin-dependent (E)-4-hydroxy-3-methylbut-2-enyl-diphosphate synthase [Eggerthellaceae bacterium]|nr:flavodoxin-dependent (E)-4-hydroxy-3-methylbut-2-enyl-diphosphate synthase [Eggerthellaceae bacterium]